MPVTLVSVLARNLDAHYATRNARATYALRTCNARVTRTETCLSVPRFRHARVFKKFFEK